MTELEQEIRREIAAGGPIPFQRFMELALYHPQWGYYCRPRERAADYYTNAHVQPVFGRLIAQQIARWRAELGSPAGFTVVELGAGDGEMARQVRACLPDVPYIEVERLWGGLPERFTGVVFSNEFFDALPVRVLRRGEERRVAAGEHGFVWADGETGAEVVEVNEEAVEWLGRVARRLERGFLLSIDYGYTAEEIAAGRFPQGSLMSYRRHTALDDVLADPGERDITAHVNFSALAEEGEKLGLLAEPLRTQAQFLLAIGEADEFGSALAAPGDRLQLKTLLFGMGETFRVLVQQKR